VDADRAVTIDLAKVVRFLVDDVMRPGAASSTLRNRAFLRWPMAR
jgi:flagellar biosynthesis regulator FlbT